jgi:LuxR family maltose regulon positive regulatory protein
MREMHATLAKLTRPKLFAVGARERLFQVLDDRLAHPIAWITGPPGAGKTTLLSGYVESRQRPALWYQIDTGDADIATFFYYLGVAAEVLAETRHVEPLPALTPEYLPDLPGFTRRFLRQLFAGLPPNALLVLDDYHEVALSSPLHGVIAWALAEIPDGVGCIVASRADPPQECARHSANQVIVTLGWEELRLTHEETAAIALSRHITDEAVVTASHDRSDGWVAGLILLLGQPSMPPLTGAQVLAPSSKSLFNYFAGIFANTISAETRDVLLSTAWLTTVTGRVATRLSGNERAEDLLRALHEGNCFVHRRVESEPVYQFHALFHEFLVTLVHQRSTPTERLAKMRQTADVLSECGDDEQAAILYGEAGDWARATDIMLRLAVKAQ